MSLLSGVIKALEDIESKEATLELEVAMIQAKSADDIKKIGLETQALAKIKEDAINEIANLISDLKCRVFLIDRIHFHCGLTYQLIGGFDGTKAGLISIQL